MTTLPPRARKLVDAYSAEIERHVADAFYSEALESLMDMTRDFAPRYRREAVLLYSSYSQLRRDRRVQTDDPDSNTELQRIADSILDLATQIESRAAESTEIEVPSLDSASEPPEPDPDPSGDTRADGSIHSELNVARTEYWRDRRQIEPGLGIPALRCERVTKSFGRFSSAPISLTARPGEITGIVGMNASGKTTLLRLCLGEIAPTSGRITYPALAGSTRQDWAKIKRTLGYVPQLPDRWHGRLIDNLHHVARAYGLVGTDNRDRVDYLLHRYGLHEFRNSLWSEIAGGFRIRFELVRAMLTSPRVLFLDEPLAYLDIVAQQILLFDVKAIATSLASPIPVIVTSQHLYEIESIADRILILDNGEVIFYGPPNALHDRAGHLVFEFSITGASRRSILEALRPLQLNELERTMTGYIASFLSGTSKSDVLQHLSTRFGDQLLYARDITSSTRRLFRNKRDDLSRSEDREP